MRKSCSQGTFLCYNEPKLREYSYEKNGRFSDVYADMRICRR